MARGNTSILLIPPEITEHALVLSHPTDVAHFAQTCRLARQLVYQTRDQHLWRRLYMEQPFDDPRKALDIGAGPGLKSSVDWMGELQRRIHAVKLLAKPDIKAQDVSAALETLIEVIRSAPMPLDKTDESKDLRWVSCLIHEHKLFSTNAEDKSGHCLSTRNELRESWQELSQLWSYIGWRDLQASEPEYEIETRNHARSFVYDLRNYTSDALWGPFMHEPVTKYRVNWSHIASIIKVVHSNLKDLGTLWSDTRPPRTLRSLQPYTAPNCINRDPRDWAGVEGTWRRYVCFMDYRDLFSYNFSVGNNGPYDPEFFEAEDFQEATRLIELKIHIERLIYPNSSSESRRRGSQCSHYSPSPSASDSNYSPSPPSSISSGSPPSSPSSSVSSSLSSTSSIEPSTSLRGGDKQVLPIISFKGTSRGGNGNEADVRGTVRMTPDGHIRWRFASIYDGRSQWSSEGVQIGSVGSAAGVVGTWTGARHEDGDPAGPFWLWKVEDDHPSHMHTHPFI